VTCDDALDLPVPGQKYTFGVVKAAQARGDFQVLIERGAASIAGASGGAIVNAGLATLTASGPRSFGIVPGRDRDVKCCQKS